ncbi:bifunctional protein (secreted sugar binding protein/sugar hydrolase) [Candidatus Burkholderia verschuerenii]|uniref:Bifunctional protein (Secreted sugar binding protein/sugar hydrolase) n=1 Tax=Candidatus Burkholderia verschuerenii TaxID=242163 RepID=A0A0L0MB65_9BURK|nr:sialidase family protein [Candidatus Burkholderia verschuerenii]KND59962.1 bifunctional protein (secreted sugar binding protein/sugar hydrolase) [Candidatus Burkholderia verschuerenii]
MRPNRLVLFALSCLLVFFAGCGGGSSSPSTPTTIGKTAIPESTLYPRVVRLSHAPAADNGKLIASAGGIFQSVDNGATFTPLSTVATVTGSKPRCCATLFEMPVTVGALPAGTLLRAGSYWSGASPAIEIYISTDQGKTWSYYDTPAIRGDGLQGGLWEPEFSSLACKIEFAGMDPTTQSGADVNAHLSQVCSARVEVEA